MITRDKVAEAERVLIEDYKVPAEIAQDVLTAVYRALFQKNIYKELLENEKSVENKTSDEEPELVKNSDNERIIKVGRGYYRVRYYYDILDDGTCDEGYQVTLKERNRDEVLIGYLDIEDVGELDDISDDDLFDIISNIC